ncbi:hypothetical protein HHI36_011448 [Cryptolaemus montrouzieri]|uniref:Uncharacterized protein n=1 Tax=Cryptolaemus montrouzieri TaxID=559131 RepID=A0ABD2MLT4_9CUCU
MELDLCRVDYTIIGLTSKNCMKLLPPAHLKEPQKVAVADRDGILQVFSIKKEDISLTFKTLPGPEISSLELAGALGRLISLIACEGRMVRVLEHGRVTISMEVDSAPTVLYILEQDEEKTVLFGTVDGRVGILDVKNLQGFERWLIGNNTNVSSISCIDSYDLTGDGNNNLIVGKQDGNIEIYNINIADQNDTSFLIFLFNCNESVTAIQCGILTNGGFDEVLVSTYTGRIFGLTTEKIEKNIEKNSQGENFIHSIDTANKITKLRNEIEDMQRKVTKEREKYQSSTQSFFDEFSAIPLLSVNDSFILDKGSATYTLAIEVPTAIDNILLQSNVVLDLLDVEKNSAVVSYSECSPSSGNALLVTYRCQMNTNRLEIKIRTIEGQGGVLQAYITPLVQPKCSRVRRYKIKPLSHHFRIHNAENSGNANTLNIKGKFSLAEMHTWIFKAVPEVPEKPQSSVPNETNNILFKSAFLGTFLQCSYA